MRGKHADVKNIRKLGLDYLLEMAKNGIGKSKHYYKRIEGGTDDKIFSYETLNKYYRIWNQFCDMLKESGYKANGHTPRTLEEARGFVPEYLRILQSRPGTMGAEHLSAWTIQTYCSAINKVLKFNTKEYKKPTRHYADIRKSRLAVDSDKSFSIKNNQDLIRFCMTTGLRKNKELAKVRGTDLVQRDDGRYAIHVVGKGGRSRDAGIYGPDEDIELVVSLMRAAGDDLAWPRIHSHADVHHFRAIYACRVYLTYARDPHDLPRDQRYCCRGHKAGIWYDRDALKRTSLELGHKRVNVVANNYLYALDEALSEMDSGIPNTG